MKLQWRKRDWLDPADPAGWWYVHRDAAAMILVGCVLAAFVAGLAVGLILALVAT